MAVYLHFLFVVEVVAKTTKSGYFAPISRHYDDNQYNEDLMVVIYNKSCIDSNYSSNGQAVDKLLKSSYPCIESTDEHLVLYSFEISFFNTSDKSCVQNKVINYDDLCINNLEYDTYVTKDMLTVQNDRNFECVEKNLSFADVWNLEFFNGPNEFDNDTIYKHPIINDTGIDIYVIDTGIFKQHVEFDDARRYYKWLQWPPFNFVEVTSTSMHGTLVAAVIVGKNVGVSDINDFTLYNVNLGLLNSQVANVPNGVGLLFLWSKVIRNIQLRRNAKRAIINCSFGKKENNQFNQWLWNEIYKKVKELGGIIVAAAANEGLNICEQSYKLYPSTSEHVIGVGGLAPDGSVEPRYNYGDCIDLFAPATNVYTALIWNSTTLAQPWWDPPFFTNLYGYVNGTSLATPHITGLIASILMQQSEYVRMHATNEMILDYLTSEGKHIVVQNGCQQQHCYAPFMQCNSSDFESFFYNYGNGNTQQPTYVPTSAPNPDVAMKTDQYFIQCLIFMFVILF